MFLSVIIPAYNEEKRIVPTLLLMHEYLSKQSYDYEIMVVNDGSTDNTAAVVKDLQLKIQHLRLQDNQENHGKGYVVRQGLLLTSGQYRLFADADNSTDIQEIEKLFLHSKEYDVVVGSRNLPGANITNPQPLRRRFLGRCYGLMVKIITGFSGVYDTQCGFKLFNEKVLAVVLPKCSINGYSFDVEMLLLAKKQGFSIKETPVSWMDNKGSKVNFSGMQKAVFDLVKIRWNLMLGRYNRAS